MNLQYRATLRPKQTQHFGRRPEDPLKGPAGELCLCVHDDFVLAALDVVLVMVKCFSRIGGAADVARKP